MGMNGTKLGELLMEADIITKRQLAKACQKQTQGDKRKLGEILVEMGFVTVEDLTEVMMEQANKAQTETEKGKRDRLLQKQITKSKSKPKPEPVVANVEAQPVEISEDKVLNTKFTLSVQTMVAAGTGLASLIGMWYALQAEIQEAKELPSLETLYQQEYPSRPEGYNWPRSFEQYKDNVEGLQDEMDGAYDMLEEMEDLLKELREDIKDLERRKKDKK
mgnify:CR=1 FL=1|tara:strand:+ start:482 stop:1138 length:657 start_codon:yes stop_codon:yes gene_type:complete